MRELPVEIQAEINRRGAIKVRNFFWVQARNRSTGETETLGLWNGDDSQNFVVDGQARTYFGAGAFLQFDDLQQESMLHIRSLRATASPISPELATVLRTYDPKFAPVEVHVGFYSPDTNSLVSPLYRVFKGWIDKFPLKTPAVNETGVAEIQMVGHTRLLTKKTPSKRSNESQMKRSANDTFFKDVGMTGTVITPWGAEGVGSSGGLGGRRFLVSRAAGLLR